MKKNKVLWITVSVGCILICIICVTAFLLISNENKSSKYYEQMRSARQYVTDGDYESIIAAYKAAIDLKPEDPQAYMELSELYMELGEYEQAYEVAQLGYSNTQDRRFRTLINDIELVRYDDRENSSDDEKKIAEQKSQDVTLRYVNIETVTDYCYQEYVDEYGDATMTYVSADEGYRAKFAGFNGYAYFKNTSKYPTLIDTSTRIPEKNSRPYKVVITSPSGVFVGFNGYISYERLCQLFKNNSTPVYDNDLEIYVLNFEFADSQIMIETDKDGNISKENPMIQISLEDPVKEEWVEKETETEPETEERTFMLGSHEYTYDVTSIMISYEVIEDLSPLQECEDLKELYLEGCVLGSLEPLSGCTSLEVLGLRGSTGFSDISPLKGLSSLKYLDLHGCWDVSDISAIMDMNLLILHTCESGVSYEQTLEYKEKHPECEVWYDNTTI